MKLKPLLLLCLFTLTIASHGQSDFYGIKITD
jgi:hypothetical protein